MKNLSPEVKALLKEYSTLPKKGNGEGKKFRRKLRKLGYYLSKNKPEKKEDKE